MGRPSAPLDDDWIELGQVVGVFGFRGEVKLHLDNPESHLFGGSSPVRLVSPDGTFRDARLSARPGAGKRVLGRIAGLDTEDGARALGGWRVFARKADLPAAEEDELYVWQLEGAEVELDGAVVGRVLSVFPSGPVAILEIAAGRREPALVPLAADFVVSAVPGRVVLRAGALDEDDADERG